MMNIELRRIRHRPETIDGQILIDGRRVCDCAENAHHCLPRGTYQIAVIKCRQHARNMPVVCDSDNDSANAHCSQLTAPCSSCPRKPYIGINTSMPRKCVQLCPGNGVYNRTDGAIIVGEYLVPGCLKHPKTAFDNLYDRIRKNIERGSEVTLTIR